MSKTENAFSQGNALAIALLTAQEAADVPAWFGVIPGAPVTKKNHSRIIAVRGRPMILPSRQFIDWQKQAAKCLERPLLPFACPLSCQAMIYRSALRGDAVNYYQAIADLLEHCGIVENDKWIVDWDGSRLLKDKDNPRVEVRLFRVQESPQ